MKLVFKKAFVYYTCSFPNTREQWATMNDNATVVRKLFIGNNLPDCLDVKV